MSDWIPSSSRSALCALVLLALSAPLADASPWDTYGVLPQGVGQSGAVTASADDATAAYYNPAGLGFAGVSGRTSLSLGYGGGVPFVDVARQRTNPEALERHPTREPHYEGWVTLGSVFPLGSKLKNLASIGLLISMPQDKLVTVESLDPRDPQWLRYQSHTDRLSLALSLGVRLGDYVAVGAGVNVMAGVVGRIVFEIEPFTRQVERRDLSIELQLRGAPIAGVVITPGPRLKLGVSYRGALGLDIEMPTTLGMGELGTLFLDVGGLVHYTPHELSFGAQYVVDDRLSLSADLLWSMWRFAPYPATSVAVDYGGEVPESVGLDEALTFRTRDPATGFQDTLTPSISAQYVLPDDMTRLRVGYAYRPTYVPNQRQASNYLDATAHVVGLGLTLAIIDPSEFFSRPIMVDLAAQAHVMQRRVVTKSATDDPVGNYDFGGAVASFAAALRYEF